MHLTIQLSVNSKLGKGVFDPIIQITYKDIEQCRAPYQYLEDTTCDRLPTWVKIIDAPFEG